MRDGQLVLCSENLSLSVLSEDESAIRSYFLVVVMGWDA